MFFFNMASIQIGALRKRQKPAAEIIGRVKSWALVRSC